MTGGDFSRTVDPLMVRGAREGVFPGAVLLVSCRGQVRFQGAYGVRARRYRTPVSLDTVFDLASLTKPLATAAAVACLVTENRLDPAQCIGSLLPLDAHGDKARITIDQLLRHTAGFSGHRPYYRALTASPGKCRRQALRQMILADPLISLPGRCQVYSDLGYVILAWIVETVAGMPLDQFAADRLFAPLGLPLFFRRHFADHLSAAEKEMFAATEHCAWRGGVLQGDVHDDNAWVVGGVEGHAGLFGTARGVWALLDRLLGILKGKNDLCISSQVLQEFASRRKGQEMVAGFDTPALEGSSAGRLFSSMALGHLGFTGTSFWMDPPTDTIVVLLTNRVHPSRKNTKIHSFRPEIHDRIMETIGCCSP